MREKTLGTLWPTGNTHFSAMGYYLCVVAYPVVFGKYFH